jgi:hypothetical protein
MTATTCSLLACTDSRHGRKAAELSARPATPPAAHSPKPLPIKAVAAVRGSGQCKLSTSHLALAIAATTQRLSSVHGLPPLSQQPLPCTGAAAARGSGQHKQHTPSNLAIATTAKQLSSAQDRPPLSPKPLPCSAAARGSGQHKQHTPSNLAIATTAKQLSSVQDLPPLAS